MPLWQRETADENKVAEASTPVMSALQRELKVSASTFVPRSLRMKDCRASDSDEAEDSKSSGRTNWKVSSSEFVPRSLRVEEEFAHSHATAHVEASCASDKSQTKVESSEPEESKEVGKICSDGKPKPTWGKPTWGSVEPAAPSDVDADSFPVLGAKAKICKTPSGIIITAKKRAVSTSTLNTTEGSASSADSGEEVLSSASETSISRSASPVPTSSLLTSLQEKAQPISVCSLLRWRHCTSSRDAKLPFAAEPAPGTPEAAIAAAVADMAGEESSPAPPLHESATASLPCESEPTMSWRQKERAFTAPVAEEKAWRNVDVVKKLEVTEGSWVSRQRARRNTMTGDSTTKNDEEIVRTMKSLLNKLTIERFDAISQQLLQCGVHTSVHLQLMIDEIFQKATTQHHFIDMYADLCSFLNDNGVINDPKVKFKKVLLTCCQASFEKHLSPPAGLDDLNNDDRTVAENLYKTRMLGNIRFVGALLVRKMLATKVLFAIMEELLQDPTSEALESLAALLMVVGPGVDYPDWPHLTTFNAVFKQVEKFSKKESVPKRVRCLLKDVMELRKAGWNDKRPKKIEGPLKLDQVALKAASENGCESPSNKVSDGEWEVMSGSRVRKTSSPCSSPKAVDEDVAAKSKLAFMKCSEKLRKLEVSRMESKQESPKEPKASVKFDKEACRAEISATLAELRVSHDVPDAIVRIGNIGIPASRQGSELNKILTSLAEEGSHQVRKVGLGVIVGLFVEKHWKPESAKQGIRKFVEETCEDLKCDVPALAKIACEEMHPAFEALVEINALDSKLHDCFTSI